jgi:hypothetical protein
VAVAVVEVAVLLAAHREVLEAALQDIPPLVLGRELLGKEMLVEMEMPIQTITVVAVAVLAL